MSNVKIAVSFRPSSHSEDGTIVATFKSEEEAKAAAKKLELVGDKQKKRHKNLVLVGFWNADFGTIPPVAQALKNLGAAQTRVYNAYQELTVEFEFPLDVPPKMLPLLFDADSLGIWNWFSQQCQKQEFKRGGKQIIQFFYCGDAVYLNPLNSAVTSEQICVDGKRFKIGRNIQVRAHLMF
jgi:hypothetical protein